MVSRGAASGAAPPGTGSIERFVVAQDGGLIEGCRCGTSIETAFIELDRGRKTSHWIWYVLPQFLDRRRDSVRNSMFQIRSLEEGIEYLAHPVLFQRLYRTHKMINTQLMKLVEGSKVRAEGKKEPVKQLMGTAVDAKKLHQSSTTFYLIISHLLLLGDSESSELRPLANLVDSNLDLIASHPYRPGKFAKLDVDMVSRMEEELHREESAKAAHERVSREANPRERQGGGAATGTASEGEGS
eukprot:CAMPEP_0182527790 /NCGR_PEP_ID=MMETSP1323-20130603/4080_1 /TAXON_ID=236787 /ORGANISM="Florenciella parvula, Strain RCC1693" /LENGTH=241 /DNA_ID=CAMNT_0024736821 /DNA_START=99 /DNA_END=821 /DNA_ORIENTATION=+